jgi:hypothetical protein
VAGSGGELRITDRRCPMGLDALLKAVPDIAMDRGVE